MENNKMFESNFSVSKLEDDQLSAVLPNWNDIFDKIENCRTIAKNGIFKENESKNPDILSVMSPDILEHTKFCNVFSILGGRGSGKSSVLYTLRKKLVDKSKETGDIILPLILPELVDSDNTLIGWVLSSLKPIVEKLNEKYYRKPHGNGFFADCQYPNDSLLALYTNLSKKCFNVDASAHYSYQENQGILRDKSKDRVDFYDELAKFWSLLSQAASKYNEDFFKSKDSHPMIIIMLDDIDLSPERCMELLMDNMKCFSNINVIVIVSAAFKSLKQALECKMFEKITGATDQSFLYQNTLRRKANGDILPATNQNIIISSASVERTAIAFIDKTLPPTSRYFLEKYSSLDKKQMFKYIKNDGKNININDFLYEHIRKLKDKAIELNKRFLEQDRLFYPMKEESPLFLEEDSTGTKTIIKIYLAMFGEKSRSMTNGCTAINNTINLLCDEMDTCLNDLKSITSEKKALKWDEYSQRVYNIIIRFVSAMLDSHPDIRENANDIAKNLIKYKYNNHEIFVDYNCVSSMYAIDIRNYLDDSNDSRYENSAVKINKIYLAIYMILAFSENLIAMTIYKKSRVHIVKHLVAFTAKHLNCKNVFLYKPYEDRAFFENYSDVMEMLFTTEKDIFSDNDSLDIFLDSKGIKRALGDDISKNSMLEAMPRLYNTDRDYCMTLIRAMAKRFSGITNLNVKMLPEVNKTLARFSNWSTIYHNNIYGATRIAQLACSYQKKEFLIIGDKNIKYKKIVKKIVGNYTSKKEIVSDIDLVELEGLAEQCIRDTIKDDKQKYFAVYIPRVLIDYAINRTTDNNLKSFLSDFLTGIEKYGYTVQFDNREFIYALQQEMLSSLFSVLVKRSVKYEGSEIELNEMLEYIKGQTPEVDCKALLLQRNSIVKTDCVFIALEDFMNLLDEVEKCISDLKNKEAFDFYINVYQNMAVKMDENIRKFANAMNLCWVVEDGKEDSSIKEAIDFLFTLKLYVISTAYLCALDNYREIKGNSLNRTSKELEEQYIEFVKDIIKRESNHQHTTFTRDAHMCICSEISSCFNEEVKRLTMLNEIDRRIDQ